jgi:hypothetical protein
MTSNTTTSMGIFPLFFGVTNLDFAETADQLKAHVRDGRKRFGNARLERSRATTAGKAWSPVPPLAYNQVRSTASARSMAGAAGGVGAAVGIEVASTGAAAAGVTVTLGRGVSAGSDAWTRGWLDDCHGGRRRGVDRCGRDDDHHGLHDHLARRWRSWWLSWRGAIGVVVVVAVAAGWVASTVGTSGVSSGDGQGMCAPSTLKTM